MDIFGFVDGFGKSYMKGNVEWGRIYLNNLRDNSKFAFPVELSERENYQIEDILVVDYIDYDFRGNPNNPYMLLKHANVINHIREKQVQKLSNNVHHGAIDFRAETLATSISWRTGYILVPFNDQMMLIGTKVLGFKPYAELKMLTSGRYIFTGKFIKYNTTYRGEDVERYKVVELNTYPSLFTMMKNVEWVDLHLDKLHQKLEFQQFLSELRAVRPVELLRKATEMGLDREEAKELIMDTAAKLLKEAEDMKYYGAIYQLLTSTRALKEIVIVPDGLVFITPYHVVWEGRKKKAATHVFRIDRDKDLDATKILASIDMAINNQTTHGKMQIRSNKELQEKIGWIGFSIHTESYVTWLNKLTDNYSEGGLGLPKATVDWTLEISPEMFLQF